MKATVVSDLTFQSRSYSNHLLTLPRELRNLIYCQLWTFTPIIRTQFRSTPIELVLRGSLWQNNATPLKGLPPWLQTCRSFLEEGMEEFNLIFTSTIGPHHDHMSDHKHTMLINPAARGSMTIWVDALSTSSKRRTKHGAYFKFSITGLNAIDHILYFTVVDASDGLFVIHRSSLHTLRVKAAFINVCLYCQRSERPFEGPEEWWLDLSPLQGFEFDLDVFEFEVTGVDTTMAKSGYQHLANCWDRAMSAFQEEVRRVGKWCTRDRHGVYSMTTSLTSPKNVLFRYTKSSYTKSKA